MSTDVRRLFRLYGLLRLYDGYGLWESLRQQGIIIPVAFLLRIKKLRLKGWNENIIVYKVWIARVILTGANGFGIPPSCLRHA